MVKSTGEVKQYQHDKPRSTQFARNTADKLRNLILSNITTNNSSLITISYQQSIVYEDMVTDMTNYIIRSKRKVGEFEYIIKSELQKRGVWHCHTLVIFPDERKYIDFDRLKRSWNKGSVYIQAVTEPQDTAKYMIKSLYNE